MPEPQASLKSKTRLRPRRVLAAGVLALLTAGAVGFAVGLVSSGDEAELTRLRARLASLEDAPEATIIWELSTNERLYQSSIPSPSVATLDERGFLGVYGQDAKGGGATLSAVIAETPADRAGLEAGDLILMVDQQPIANYQDLHAEICSRDPKDLIQVMFRRDGSLTLIELELGSFQAYQQNN